MGALAVFALVGRMVMLFGLLMLSGVVELDVMRLELSHFVLRKGGGQFLAESGGS